MDAEVKPAVSFGCFCAPSQTARGNASSLHGTVISAAAPRGARDSRRECGGDNGIIPLTEEL